MIRKQFGGLAATCLLLYTSASAQTPTPTLSFGNVNVQQNDTGNANTSVTLSMDYVYGTLAPRPTGNSRGDFLMQMGPVFSSDRANGILITTVSENGRDNTAGGDAPALRYATSSVANSGGGWFVPVHNTSSGEWNTNFAAAYFPYAEGWIGGHAVATNGVLNTQNSALAPGLTISTTGLGDNVIYDRPETGLPEGETATPGVYQLRLAGINSMTDGILLTNGGDNSNTFTRTKANADGSWSVYVGSNSTNGATAVNGSFGFVYVPKTSAVSSPDQAGIHAMGRVNSNMTRDISVGNYVLVHTNVGTYKLYAPGIDPQTATLLLGMEADTGDNILTYGATEHGWVISNRDLPTGTSGLQDTGNDLLSFAIMTGGNTAAVWDAGGANADWSTGANWAGDGAPTADKDVILGTGGASVLIDSAQEAGMVFINRDTSFNITGTAPLTIHTGLILNSAPTSAQTYTVSAPIILGNHAFIISQSMTSAVTLRFDVTSGNAITSNGFNLTLDGAGSIEWLDPISLGTGFLIKDGEAQVNLSVANTVGGTVINSGYTGTGNAAAFRFVAAGAWGAFSTSDIIINVSRGSDVTTSVLYFDSGGGSGSLSNNISIQSGISNANIRIHLDSGAGLNARLAGVISGGNDTSIFYVTSDAANGQGKLHLQNTANTFVTERIQVNGGGLFIYGDGSLGAAENDVNLNTSNTNDNTGSGLHFAADNIVLNAARSITMTSNSVLHTEGHNATIEGVISGTGSIFKEGAGVLSLTGINTLTGKIRVNAGMVAINSEESLGGAPAAFAADQLALNNGAGLQALSDLVIDDANRGITVGVAGGDIDTKGYHMRVDSVITALGELNKRGAGMLELTAANTFSNFVTVHEGTLAVNNATASATGAGSVMVKSGAAIGGKGIIDGTVTVEGRVAPGVGSTGELVFNGGLELLQESRVELEIASQEEFDRIVVIGSLGVDSSTLFEVTLLNGPVAGWEFDLVDWGFLSFDDDLSDNFVLPNLAAWNMEWNTDNIAEGRLQIAQIVPEPSRALLLLGGAVMCLMRRRRAQPVSGK